MSAPADPLDVLLSGGVVIDPASGFNGRADVGIRGERIAVVEPRIDPSEAATVIDVGGLIVTPGLIDLHTHAFPGATFWGVRPDPIAAATGVTTWVDAGSAGAFNLPGFVDTVVRPSAARVLSLINISAIGLTAHDFELRELGYCDIDLLTRVVAAFPETVHGVKVRMGTSTVGANGLEPLRRAVTAANELARPLMVHIATGPPTLEAILPLMRPGDIVTHSFTGQTMSTVDEHGSVRPAVREALDAGILLDVGHGSGSFSFRRAESALAQGILPDVISSDIHQLSIGGPMYDLPTVLSKFWCLGLSLDEVVARATIAPARAIGRAGELGTLEPGAPADVAVFATLEGEFTFYDIDHASRTGNRLLRNRHTIIAGRLLEQVPPDPPAIATGWARAGLDTDLLRFQAELRERGHTPDAMAARDQL